MEPSAEESEAWAVERANPGGTDISLPNKLLGLRKEVYETYVRLCTPTREVATNRDMLVAITKMMGERENKGGKGYYAGGGGNPSGGDTGDKWKPKKGGGKGGSKGATQEHNVAVWPHA